MGLFTKPSSFSLSGLYDVWQVSSKGLNVKAFVRLTELGYYPFVIDTPLSSFYVKPEGKMKTVLDLLRPGFYSSLVTHQLGCGQRPASEERREKNVEDCHSQD
jgi:hypothetical protein